MLLLSEAMASIRALQADNTLQYLFQETQYDDMPVSGRQTEESSHGETDRRRKGYLVVNSVLFRVDPADHFGKFGSEREERTVRAIIDTDS
jgi:hypothetical protein